MARKLKQIEIENLEFQKAPFVIVHFEPQHEIIEERVRHRYTYIPRLSLIWQKPPHVCIHYHRVLQNFKKHRRILMSSLKIIIDNP